MPLEDREVEDVVCRGEIRWGGGIKLGVRGLWLI